MKVLVTGANGFVGQHVRRELERAGHDLLTPSSRELNLVNPAACSGIGDVPIHYGYPIPPGYPRLSWTTNGIDALLFYLLEHEFDAIVHLAATCGGIGINAENPGRFIYENLQMGTNVLEAARLAGVPKVVLLGSVCSYPKHCSVPFKEDDLWNGYPEETNAPYGIAKKAIMEMGIAYSRQYGMNITNLIPTNMAGEWDNFDDSSSHVIPALIKKFESPEVNCMCSSMCSSVTLWGTGSASREFLYAGDCARAIALSLEKDTGPQPINLGAGEEITIHNLAIRIRNIGEYNSDIIWDKTKPDGQPRRLVDCTRAKEVLGWEATTPLDETIARTIEWYRDE